MPYNKNNIACVVVIYNPDVSVARNIHTYINAVDHVYIVDNSEMPDFSMPERRTSFSYVANGNNLGVAHALNQGAKMAIEDGYAWLLTMDQDSTPAENMIAVMIDRLNSMDTDMVGIVSPVYNLQHKTATMDSESWVLTSGNLLNLSAYRLCGDFEEKLFIDHIDHEYCLRLRKHGYHIEICQNAFLAHELGDSLKSNFLFYRRAIVQHSTLRWYYFLRNGLYVSCKYVYFCPGFLLYFIKQAAKELLKILLVYGHKTKYLKITFEAIRDAIIGHYGKYGDKNINN